ncbi:MAG: hypothetical protein QM572_08025 [Nocardioides sp.]|uniref:hypothetical protein n=1 Tax=Nocardioides sp. TaxID=35761 RepID=UPI0039E71A70
MTKPRASFVDRYLRARLPPGAMLLDYVRVSVDTRRFRAARPGLRMMWLGTGCFLLLVIAIIVVICGFAVAQGGRGSLGDRVIFLLVGLASIWWFVWQQAGVRWMLRNLGARRRAR